MSLVESQSYRAVTEAPGFDYGSGGRGGWDEAQAIVVSDRKRPKKERFIEDAAFHIACAEVQGRRASEIGEMKCEYRKRGRFKMLVRRPAVYLILNVVTREMYVGSAGHFIARWKKHVAVMRQRKHKRRINGLVRRHGIESFRFFVLEELSPKQDGHLLLEREAVWTRRMKPTLGGEYRNVRPSRWR